ncbi:MAG: HPF/RaiA family ribosome-associated protein [Dehalococcoidales bacterium]|nr:HPF/RaiA family ribosome-associated protein [Dehalococcoidales bacterium]
MQVPLEVSYRNVEKTGDIESLLRRRVSKLEQICDYMISCRVAIEQLHRRQQTANPYRVRIDVTVPPGHKLIARRISIEGEREEPLAANLRRAFDAMERQLRELVEKQRADVKKHPETEVMALVEQIFPEKDYGFLRTLDGRQVYFHRNSVLHGEFERLKTGTGVRFSEELGEKGVQATTVEIEDKPGSNV